MEKEDVTETWGFGANLAQSGPFGVKASLFFGQESHGRSWFHARWQKETIPMTLQPNSVLETVD